MSWKIKIEMDSLLCPYFAHGGCKNPKSKNRYCNQRECIEKIVSGGEAEKMVAGSE